MDLGTAIRQQKIQPSHVVADDYYPFGGGLNLVDPPYTIQPGECLQAVNYEPYTRGGYARCDGYERFDGQGKPSQASYWILNYVSLTGNFSIGQIVRGQTSGATGLVQAVSIGTPTSTGYLVLEIVIGTYSVSENLQVAGVTQAISNGSNVGSGAPTDALDFIYKQQAIADQRARITSVPGAGMILGVQMYNGNVYTFRNNAGNSAAVLFKQSATGWTAITLNYKLRFINGTLLVNEGDSIRGATSGVTAVAIRVVLQTGSWAGGDAAGYFILTSYAGAAFTANEIINDVTQASTACCKYSSKAQQTLLPNGFYEFRVWNFYGNTGRIRMYGCDGANNGFEYDDTKGFFHQIETGMTTDAPQHLEQFNNQLFFSFANGSLQMSSIGDPGTWQVVTGAAELGLGDNITGIFVQIGSLLVFTRTHAKILSGTSLANYVLSEYSITAGAIPWTIQRIGSGVFLDDAGVSSIQNVADYGDFNVATLSQKIQPLIASEKGLAVSSTINRTKNLYRVFFSDGSGLSMCLIGGKLGSNYKVQDNVTGIMPLNYGLVTRCCTSEVNPNTNAEELYFGSDTGYIYQNDIGTSFDGQPITSIARLAYNFNKEPQKYKRYRQANFQIQANGPATINYGFDYNYSSGAAESTTIAASASGGVWDVSQWDNFKWDQPGSYTNPIIKLHSSGYNLGVLLYHSQSTENAHILQGVNIQYSMRRIKREAG